MYTGAMALYIRQQDSRSELQERVAAELREKLKHGENEEQLTYEKPVDSVRQGTHESRHLGPVVVLVAALILLGVMYLLFGR